MKKKRLYALDLLRIISVIEIFLFHSYLHMGCKYGLFTPLIRQGAVFMVCFFMVSGFVLYYCNYEKVGGGG